MDKIKQVNDFVLRFTATEGSGAVLGCHALSTALFRMGVYVSCRRIPHHLEFLICYEIRINERGYLGQRGGCDFVLALHQENIIQEYQDLDSNGYFLYNSDTALPEECEREDILPLGLPLTSLCLQSCKKEQASETNKESLQQLENIAAIGTLASFIDIPQGVITETLEEHCTQITQKIKSIPPSLPIATLKTGYDYAADTYPQRTCSLSVTQSHAVRDSILIDGNSGIALGALDGRATTAIYEEPALDVKENTTKPYIIKKFRESYIQQKNKTRTLQIEKSTSSQAYTKAITIAKKENRRSFIAAETRTLSLLAESIGTAYFKEIPAVIVNIQEPPSLICGDIAVGGTMQGDIFSCVYASFGDSKHILLFPCNPVECFTMTSLALDIATKLQTPVFLMSERTLAENRYVCEPLTGNAHYYQKLLAIEDIEEHNKKDHEKNTSSTVSSEIYEENLTRLAKKQQQAQKMIPKPHAAFRDPNNQIGVIFYGTTTHAAYEAIGRFAAKGIKMNTLRIRAFPFLPAIIDFVRDHRRIFLIEQNCDAQMKRLLVSEAGIAAGKIESLLHYNGMPLTVRFIEQQLARML